MVKGKKIVLGVTGGIAAYKACTLTSRLTQAGADVKVIMTTSAAKFVSPLTFQALSRNPVFTDTFDEKDPTKIAHIDLADWADLVLIAPATANIIGKMANGLADDMLSTMLLATQAPVYIAPAMNVHMYAHPAVIDNMKSLEGWGYRFIEPGDGLLACGYVGKGRLEEPEAIVEVLKSDIERESVKPILEGKRVLVSAGPTKEKIDPVRYFTNHSTGKMGFALAAQAAKMGAEVTLVSGPVSLATPSGVNRIDVETAEQMYRAMIDQFVGKDIVIKAAAVADYRPASTYEEKMKKQPGDWTVEMERTKDILQELGKRKQKQYLVGFAAETLHPLQYGRKKLESKNLDAIVINNIKTKGAGFGTDKNEVTFINNQGLEKTIELAEKTEVAGQILELISAGLKDESR
ncbi:bifunctional phosphopantothenoylcysteine decarboxylase/phosphopantothenate--cysteine ligase CoaBC [Sediminibacillus dalangtanensis]|uniref:Coenzyme A biosynthesis bifunctional protein CoaBC n=1 Tax=Sediminibacillus dalangtanensis TaxID=2729421 RepID=A0ABX7VR01_9BACI|nr:bifunctional phosphopantothenoylcysteine decarboxylase/phosphopantothenate--cysteine ligase CoaBC [Sediminibacillus dalangtanensis]QTM99366.1 bifunctional phosphopantothenoylcysteine decarboxylase/phosphopantothenate--cysteine ligase CoaBC [Sediminibacillus dalangtanensis]